jgi:pyruvate,water dikinase
MPTPGVGNIPIPFNFEITWQAEADAEEMWFYDKSLFRDPITPLDFELRVKSMTAGFNRANRVYQMSYVNRARLINSYTYMTSLPPSTLSHQEFASQMNIAVGKVREAITNLSTLWTEEWFPEIQEILAYWEGYDLRGATWAALHQHLAKTRQHVERLWEVHHLLLQPTMLALSTFEELYQDLFSDSHPFEAHHLLTGFNNKMVETGQHLWDLSRQALELPIVKESFSTHEASEVIAKLAETEEGRAFWQEIEKYLQVHGQRNEMMYLDEPSWLEEPTAVIHTLQDYIRQPERDLNAEMEELVNRRQRLLSDVRQRLQGYPQPIVDKFESALKTAQVANVLTEDHNYWIDHKITYHTRQICLEIGRRLVQNSLIEQPADLFYLTSDELSKEGLDLRSLISKRQAEAQRFAALTPPPVVGSFVPFPPMNDSISKSGLKFSGLIPVASKNPNEIRGYPGSSGQVRGKAKVLHKLAEATKLEPGDILVASVTSPSWTLLFANVAAIVTDTGGILSHAAVVAREYDIPAVVGTQRATAVLKDGQYIEVDGEQGVVRIL